MLLWAKFSCSGPRMNPCDTPENRIWNIMWTLLMLTDIFQRFMYKYRKVSLYWSHRLPFWLSVNDEVCNKKLLINPSKQYLLFYYFQYSFPSFLLDLLVHGLLCIVFSVSWNKVWQKGLYCRKHIVIYDLS